MPTYDYHCTACDTDHEIFHGMSEPAKKKCPRCGKNKLERRIGAGAGFLFKGSGFYLTDYRSESYKEGAKKDDAGASSPSSASPSNAASPPSSTSSASDAPKADSKASAPSKPAKKSGGKSKR